LWTGEREAIDAVPVGRSHLEVALRLAQAALDSSASIEAAAVVWGLLMRLGRRDEAFALDSTIDALAVTDRDRVRAARMRADAAFVYDTELDQVVTELRAIEQRAADASCRVAARATLAHLLVFGRYMREAADLGIAVMSDPDASRHDVFLGAGSASMALAELGRTADAISLLDDVGASLRPEDDSTVFGMFMALRVIGLTYAC